MEKFPSMTYEKDGESRNESIHTFNDRFENHFHNAGFNKSGSVDLVSKNDPTLLFVNSTMAPVKDLIVSETIPEEGLFMVQPCLRSNDQAALFDTSKDVVWPSYFYMIGAIVKEDQGQRLLSTATSFMNTQGIPLDKIHIKSSKNAAVLESSHLSFSDMQVQQDTEDEAYYRWKYGIEGVRGEGVTFSFENKDSELEDLGNLICIIKNDRIIAWELAFGTETMITRPEGKNVFEGSIICDILPYQDNPEFRKFSDALQCAAEIIQAGVRPGAKKEESVLRRYIKAIHSLQQAFPDLKVSDILFKYAIARGYDSNIIIETYETEVDRQINEKEKNIKKFKAFYLKNLDKELDWKKFGYESFSLSEEEVDAILNENRYE